MSLTHFYLCQEKKSSLYLQQAGNKLLSLFFHRCSYKISCFSELAYMQLQCPCANLLNCLRSVSTKVVTTEIGQNSLEVIFIKQFLTKPTIFCCFDVFFVRPPQICQVQVKISTIQTVFPDYFSVSYDYGAINVDEYFHFWWFCWPKVQN